MKKNQIMGLVVIGIILLAFVYLFIFKYLQKPVYKFQSIVLENNGESLVIWDVSDSRTDLCFVGLLRPKSPPMLVGESGKLVDADYFQPGQLIEIMYDGYMQQTYPPSIIGCSKIKVLGQADTAAFQSARNVYTEYRKVDAVIYAVSKDSSSLERIEKRIGPTPEELFEEWRKANNIPTNVKMNRYFQWDNGYEERITSENSGIMSYTTGDTLEIEIDLSTEFLDCLIAAPNENLLMASLVNTIIGDEPFYPNTFLSLTVDGTPIVMGNYDFSNPLRK